MSKNRSRAKDWNAAENWLGWLRGAQKDPGSPIEARGSLGMITGTDARVLRAVAEMWHLCSYYEDDPLHVAALEAIRRLLPNMQRSCWPFARELIAQALDWKDRDRLWEQVEPPPPRWIRYRFEVTGSDYRPVRFPPPGPYWRTAETLAEPCTYTLLALLPPAEALESWWPDASKVDRSPVDGFTYTDRFPCPDWYKPLAVEQAAAALGCKPLEKAAAAVNIKEGCAQQWHASDGTCFTFGGDLEGTIRVGDDSLWVAVEAAPMLEFVDWLMRPADEAIGRGVPGTACIIHPRDFGDTREPGDEPCSPAEPSTPEQG